MGISRRGLLFTVAATAVVTGCAPEVSIGRQASTVDPEADARSATAASEADLVASYRAAAAANPSRRAELSYLADQHQQHLAAIAPDLAVESAASSSAAAPSVAALQRMERRAARQRTDAAVQVTDTGLAELLARIAASESAHAAFLARSGA